MTRADITPDFIPFKPPILPDGVIIQLPACASIDGPIVIGAPDYSKPYIRNARSVSVIRNPDGSAHYHTWEPALSSLGAMAADGPAFDLMGIYQQAAYDAAVASVFCFAYVTPAKEKDKKDTLYIQHFKPEHMPLLAEEAQTRSVARMSTSPPAYGTTLCPKANLARSSRSWLCSPL